MILTIEAGKFAVTFLFIFGVSLISIKSVDLESQGQTSSLPRLHGISVTFVFCSIYSIMFNYIGNMNLWSQIVTSGGLGSEKNPVLCNIQ